MGCCNGCVGMGFSEFMVLRRFDRCKVYDMWFLIFLCLLMFFLLLLLLFLVLLLLFLLLLIISVDFGFLLLFDFFCMFLLSRFVLFFDF